MIDQSQSPNILAFDRQGVADRAFMQGLREDIWKSYRKWRKQNEAKFAGAQAENIKEFAPYDEAQCLPHKYLKKENAEVELDTFIPIERARPSPSKKASSGLTAEKNAEQSGTRKNAKQVQGHK
jgi:hypothetical protein